MLSQEFLKKIGILGVSFGLIASPLAFAGMQDEEYDPMEPAPQEEPAPEVNNSSEYGDDQFETEEYETSEYEYENEEEEYTFDDDSGEDQWDAPAEGDEQAW